MPDKSTPTAPPSRPDAAAPAQPLGKEYLDATETGMDRRKPHALPTSGQGRQQDDEHPASVGKP